MSLASDESAANRPLCVEPPASPLAASDRAGKIAVAFMGALLIMKIMQAVIFRFLVGQFFST